MNNAATPSNHSQDATFDIKTGPTLLSAAGITGDDVCNMQDEKLGTIQGIMLDIQTGRIRYAVLSSGGFLGLGERLFAVPWNALKQDKQNRRFILDVDAPDGCPGLLRQGSLAECG